MSQSGLARIDKSSSSSGITTINGDIGSITGSNVTIYANNATNASGGSVLFNNSGTTSTLHLSDSHRNVFLGQGAGVSGVTSQFNVGLGAFTLSSVTGSTTGNNIAVGDSALLSLNSGGGANTSIGVGSLTNLKNGSANICIGRASGISYSGSESINICIGNNGVSGDNNSIRIGNDISHFSTFIAGVSSSTIAASAPVGINSFGQLSSLDFGSSGQIFTSNGPGNSPTWKFPVTNNTENSFVDQSSAISLTTSTPIDITNIFLTSGTWMISALVEFGGAPTVSGPQDISISDTSSTHGTLGNNRSQSVFLSAAFTSGNCLLTIPTYILTLGTGTTIYLVASGTFSAGSMTAYGRISAVKIQ